MPGFVMTTATVLTCPHGGTVRFVPVAPPRVTVGGAPVLTAADQILVAGCAAQPPCVTVRWSNLDARVVTNGQPVLVQAPPPVPPPVPGNGVCIGSATPVPPLVMVLPPRVMGM